MSRKMGVFKQDADANRLWGEKLYAAIPKSVFAVIAWHLANATSESCDAAGAAEKRFAEEWSILFQGGHFPQEFKGLAAKLLNAKAAQFVSDDPLPQQAKPPVQS